MVWRRRRRRYNIGFGGTPSGMLRMPAPSGREPSGRYRGGVDAAATDMGGYVEDGIGRRRYNIGFGGTPSGMLRMPAPSGREPSGRYRGGVDAAATITMVRWLGEGVAICDRLWQPIVAATLSD